MQVVIQSLISPHLRVLLLFVPVLIILLQAIKYIFLFPLPLLPTSKPSHEHSDLWFSVVKQLLGISKVVTLSAAVHASFYSLPDHTWPRKNRCQVVSLKRLATVGCSNTLITWWPWLGGLWGMQNVDQVGFHNTSSTLRWLESLMGTFLTSHLGVGS